MKFYAVSEYLSLQCYKEVLLRPCDILTAHLYPLSSIFIVHTCNLWTSCVRDTWEFYIGADDVDWFKLKSHGRCLLLFVAELMKDNTSLLKVKFFEFKHLVEHFWIYGADRSDCVCCIFCILICLSHLLHYCPRSIHMMVVSVTLNLDVAYILLYSSLLAVHGTSRAVTVRDLSSLAMLTPCTCTSGLQLLSWFELDLLVPKKWILMLLHRQIL